MASVTSKPPISAPRQPTRSRPADRLPGARHSFSRVFRSYARRYIRRHFHALRLSADGLPPEVSNGPLIVVANHPSWWDPLIVAGAHGANARVANPLRPDRGAGPCPVPVPGKARALRRRDRDHAVGASPSCARASRSSLAPSPRSGSRPRASSSIRATARPPQAGNRPPGPSTGARHDRPPGPRVSLLERPLPRSPRALRLAHTDHALELKPLPRLDRTRRAGA